MHALQYHPAGLYCWLALTKSIWDWQLPPLPRRSIILNTGYQVISPVVEKVLWPFTEAVLLNVQAAAMAKMFWTFSCFSCWWNQLLRSDCKYLNSWWPSQIYTLVNEARSGVWTVVSVLNTQAPAVISPLIICVSWASAEWRVANWCSLGQQG